jgi:hypothetical protein
MTNEVGFQARVFPPKIIWMLWLQGWDNAPKVAQACRKSWEYRNPGWVVQCLDLLTLEHFLPKDIVENILSTPKEVEALSDQIRLELLHRYGGVWVDATAICAKPMDDWLADAMPHGFFAFAKPAPERMLSTWFIAAEKGSYVIEKWREASWSYWHGRTVRDTYFWVHERFADAYASDINFRTLWDNTPQISALHAFHFGPNDAALLGVLPSGIEDLLFSQSYPVFKLTHKFDVTPCPNSLFSRLCTFACTRNPSGVSYLHAGRRLLIAWYGSFSGHGTIGDLRSLEAVVSHFVGRGHEVLHATAADIVISGAIRVDWQELVPQACDAVVFVCGPILRNHPETQAFFEKFSSAMFAGVGVSLLPESHFNYCNPFKVLFARQGGAEAFGDVAVCAPKPLNYIRHRASRDEFVIGLALCGEQHEYGTERCLWSEVETVFEALTDTLRNHASVRVVQIENHLVRSHLSPDEIEAQYALCDLVLTTRFHGAIAALRQDVPFIAVDQIDGWGKVFPLLAGGRWDAVFAVGSVSAIDIVRIGLNLLHDSQIESLVATRCEHIRHANRTLAHLDKWLLSQ